MDNFISRTKQISALIFEPSSPRYVRPSPRTWRKGVDFKRLSCSSWDEIEISQMQRISIPKETFKVVMVPCESQPSSCRVTWQISPCIKLPGRTRRCKIVQIYGQRTRREFSGNMTCFDDKVLIWGNIKDDNKEGEDFELVLKAPSKNICLSKPLLVQGELKRGNRKKHTDFIATHDAMIFME